MIDLLLIATGAGLLGAGLWMISPAFCLVVFGILVLFLAYGKHRMDQERVVASKDASAVAK